MIFEKVSFKNLDFLSPLVYDYLYNQEKTKPLFKFTPDLYGLDNAINEINFSKENRQILTEVIQEQYKNLNLEQSNLVLQNIEFLKQENTYTVTTAHQLCLATGPLYFIYKILSTIKLAKILQAKYPHKNFVPVYWMGGEDHDFEEINHFNIYNKTIEWQKDETGAVGRLSTSGLERVVEDLNAILGESDFEQNFLSKFKKYFTENKFQNYGQSFQAFVYDLFADYGVLVLNQDNEKLKHSFKNHLIKEITEQTISNSIQPNLHFLNEHYHVQASPRDINVFYLLKNARERIEFDGEVYKVLNSNLTFTKEALLSDIEQNPENYSPNVLLRPLYQQHILPNIATIGGGGEVAYWLQLKDVFTAFNTFYPVVFLRDMAMIINKSNQKRMEEWQLNNEAIFAHKDELIKKIVDQNTQIDLTLKKEKIEIEEVYNSLIKKAVKVDKNLEKSVLAEMQKTINSFSNLESKLIRAEKKNQEQTVLQIESFKNKLFPNGVLQERYENFLPYYTKHKEAFFEQLLQHFNLLDYKMHIIKE